MRGGRRLDFAQLFPIRSHIIVLTSIEFNDGNNQTETWPNVVVACVGHVDGSPLSSRMYSNMSEHESMKHPQHAAQRIHESDCACCQSSMFGVLLHDFEHGAIAALPPPAIGLLNDV